MKTAKEWAEALEAMGFETSVDLEVSEQVDGIIDLLDEGAGAMADNRTPELEILECPVCGGRLELLGVLGNLVHLRCRSCGADFREDSADVGHPEVEK